MTRSELLVAMNDERVLESELDKRFGRKWQEPMLALVDLRLVEARWCGFDRIYEAV